MEFATYSDPIIRGVFWAAIAALLLVLLQLIAIFMMRGLLFVRQARRAHVISVWQPILMENFYLSAANLPALSRRDLISFLELWSYYHESLRGDARNNLNAIAQRIGVDRMVHAMLRKAPFQTRLHAVVAAGHLRLMENKVLLQSMLDEKSPVLSLAAARALLQIAPENVLSEVLAHIATRFDWPAARVATMLREAGVENISKPLTQMAINASPELAPRLIRFLSLVSPSEAAPAIREILRGANDDHVISTCLQVLGDPSDLDLVRQCAVHPRWHVRVQAANALGRMGGHGDEILLERMLSDKQWWVRYRAAQALVALPFVGLPQLEMIRERQTDSFAKDMLTQTIAEKTARALA